MYEPYRVISKEFGENSEVDHADFETLEKAEAFARLVAQNDEMDAYIYRLLSCRKAEYPDINPCAYNGVRPGIDFPASLSRSFYGCHSLLHR